MAQEVKPLYEFERFRLDRAKRLLWRDDKAVQLTPMSFDILLALVESGGDVVSKDKLIERVWPDSFVEEGNLTYFTVECARHHQFTRNEPVRAQFPAKLSK